MSEKNNSTGGLLKNKKAFKFVTRSIHLIKIVSNFIFFLKKIVPREIL